MDDTITDAQAEELMHRMGNFVKAEIDFLLDEFLEKYSVMNVKGDGQISVLKGFEEYVENGEILTGDELDKVRNINLLPDGALSRSIEQNSSFANRTIC